MYLSFYKVKEKPFSINTDPRFLWYGDKHREALANFTYGLMEENGYVVMTGDPGTGKTTLVNALIDTLDENVLVTKINHPTFGADEFLYLVAKSCDSTVENASKAEASDTETIKIDKFSTRAPAAVAGSWIHKEDHKNSARGESNSVQARLRAKTTKNATIQKAATLLVKKNQLILTAIGLLAAIVLVTFVGSIDLKMGSKVKTAALRHADRVTLEEKASFPARRDTLAELQQPTNNAESVSETPIQDAPKAATKLQRQQPAEEIIAYNEKHAQASPRPTIVANPSLKKTRSREAKSNEQKIPATAGSAAFTPQKTTKEFRPTTLELATAALKQQNFETAIELLEADQSLDAQKNPKARKLYSEALTGRAGQIMERSPLEAETMMRKAVEADPKNIRAHFNLGKIYTQTKKYAQAIDAYKNVVALNPNFPDAFFNLGFIYASTGNYKEAESVFIRVINLKPSYLDKALFNLALLQERLGKKQESLANLKKAVTVGPENKKVQAYLKQVEISAKESP